jgi:AcrR family transcriptional regulator
VIAQSLIGVITWIPLSVDWIEGADETFRTRTVEALADLIADGQAADRDYAFVSPIEAEAFFEPAPAPFDRAGQAAAKVEQLLSTASAIINRRGVDGTSLDDVTGALGATKGAFYHYLKNKTDLVVRCYRRAFDHFERFADAADALGRNGLEKGVIGLHLNVQAHAVGLSPLIQMVGVEALPPAPRREIRRRARALQQRYAAYGHLGIADGSNRVLDLDATAQLGAGVFEWLPKWFVPDDPRANGALAREIVQLFIRGLRAP